MLGQGFCLNLDQKVGKCGLNELGIEGEKVDHNACCVRLMLMCCGIVQRVIFILF